MLRQYDQQNQNLVTAQMPCLQGLESQAQDRFPSETESLVLAGTLWLLKK